MITYYQKINSPIGPIVIGADDHALLAITFGHEEDKLKNALDNPTDQSNAIIRDTEKQLQEYFAGKRTEFELPIRFKGTEFQEKTWRALLTIPYGETRCYQEQADRIGSPKAVRAVGTTNGLNPIAIVVPCHRVIGKSGKVAGYAGGIENKRFLLNLEGNKIL